ncbi:hypothetical protein O3P69_014868 [Scylla paramamosain]|uniref:Uncharacterized protein n=1 Tax=Scylla paramamosain TaxID=85552 RepID=A0AAW0TY86_SCYPA
MQGAGGTLPPPPAWKSPPQTLAGCYGLHKDTNRELEGHCHHHQPGSHHCRPLQDAMGLHKDVISICQGPTVQCLLGNTAHAAHLRFKTA